MLGYLELDAHKDGLEIELVKENKLGQFSPQYHKTAKQISAESKHIDGIVIPHDLGEAYDYNVLLMIIHIRLCSDVVLNQLPIIIVTGTEDQYLDFLENHTINEQVYNSIGVSIAEPPLSGSAELFKIDKTALTQFLKEKAGHPWFTQGRHDQANRWGPYVFLSVLDEVFGDRSDTLQDVEDEMFEEPYLKWLASGMGERSGIGNIRTDLNLAHHRLNTQLEELERKKILIIEDRLDDGWKQVYEEVLRGDGLNIEIIWAQTKGEASDLFSGDLGLVILDMRLANDDVTEDSPTGIKLAKNFRAAHPLVPVVVATASNKSWVLQELTDEGIDAYWVKASPEIDLDFSHAAKNVLDFYRKLTSTLEWSSKTRNWNESLYHVTEVVEQSGDSTNGKRLKEKAHSFHALMQQSFSPFSREISAGLQQNLAFLIAYSCMNDLVSWVIYREQTGISGGALASWYTEIEGEKKELVRQMKDAHGEIYFEMHNNSSKFHDFPDSSIALEILGRYRLYAQIKNLRKLSKLRNGLPLIHGKSAEFGATSARVDLVTDMELTSIINILSDLTAAHSPQ